MWLSEFSYILQNVSDNMLSVVPYILGGARWELLRFVLGFSEDGEVYP